jgi:hypothetical protein
MTKISSIAITAKPSGATIAYRPPLSAIYSRAGDFSFTTSPLISSFGIAFS